MKYFGTALTDTGIKKKINQDSLCLKIADTHRYGQVALAAVCDGVGGLAKGEIASATVIMALSEWFENVLPKHLSDYNWQSLAVEWENMVNIQNGILLKYGKSIKADTGTTLSALLIIGSRYMTVHVGDSRIYEISGSVRMLTNDQTVTAREVRLGAMTQEQAESDIRKNILLQCIGASHHVKPEISFGNISGGNVYMLCSDGLIHVVNESEIYSCFRPDELINSKIMNRNAGKIIDLVKNRKEKDNISVILLKAID